MKEILIYTDDIGNYGKYRSLIEDVEVNISHRCTLKESIKHINLKQVDLVIIDIDVPVFTNLQLWDITPFHTRDIPIIIVVSKIENDTLDRCITDYDIEVVTKQFFNTDAFSTIILKILGFNVEIEQDINDECDLDTPFCDSENMEDT